MNMKELNYSEMYFQPQHFCMAVLYSCVCVPDSYFPALNHVVIVTLKNPNRRKSFNEGKMMSRPGSTLLVGILGRRPVHKSELSSGGPNVFGLCSFVALNCPKISYQQRSSGPSP